jgi:hypothetical protein
MSSVFDHLDEVVDRLAILRDELLGDEFAVDRAARLAAVFESEARAWSQLYELSSLRLVWRAALAAEAGARANAALWAQRAARERAKHGGWSVMDSVGALILFSILGAVICAKARVAGGAVVFSLIGLVLFVSTPAGRALPEAVSGFVSAVDGAATPALTDETDAPREAAVPADVGSGASG